VRFIQARQRGLRERGEDLAHHLLLFPERPSLHRDADPAKTLQARVILVPAALVDGALAAELGLDRDHREAIRLHAAIAAAFADELVDDDALLRVGKLAALAPAPLLRGARLVVHEHAHARLLAKL